MQAKKRSVSAKRRVNVKSHKTLKTSAKLSAKRVIRSKRSLHKRFILHPITLMIMLGVGVLLIGVTWHTYAASYTVTAEIDAPLPPSPADITYPIDQTHFSTNQITVTGTCPDGNYVKLYTDGTFSGTALCVDSNFSITTELSSGDNSLNAEIYNITDNEGPTSTPISVYYDQPTVTQSVPPPVSTYVPVNLSLYSIAKNIYQSGSIMTTSAKPTLAGYAPPGSLITVTYHSNPIVCMTYADAQGNWSCTLDQALPVGLHTVYIASTLNGASQSLPPFQIKVVSSPSSNTLPAPTAVIPFYITTSYHYQVFGVGQNVSLSLNLVGGTLPFAWTISWGDGHFSTLLTNTNSANPTHSYSEPGDYIIKVETTDSNSLTSLMQIEEVVKNKQLVSSSGSVASANSNLSSLRHWLWAAWPAYLVLLLMAVSFWLGEHQEYQDLITRRKRPHGKPRT